MMTNEDADQLSQIREALEKLLDELPPKNEHTGIVCTVLDAFDEWPLEKCLEMMGIILMRGYTGLDGRMKYLSHEIEKPFRQAFAMLLRSNARLSRDVRDTLADLIAMKDDPRWRPRKIEFGFRQEGNRPDPTFESAVASIVEKHLIDGGTFEGAIEAAMAEFDLEDRMVKRYWGRYTKVMKEIGFKMPRRRKRKERI